MVLDLTKKITIWVSALSLLAIAIIVGVFVPALVNIKKTSDDSYKLRLLLEQRYEKSLNSRITKKKLEEIKTSVPNFYPFLFAPGDDLKLITFLENLSAKHNITQTIANSTFDKMGNHQMVSISMNLSGNYNDLLKHLAEMEASDYFIYITQMQFTPSFSRNGDATQIANLNLTIQLYVNQ